MIFDGVSVEADLHEIRLVLIQAAATIYVTPDGAQPRTEEQAVGEAIKLWKEVMSQTQKERKNGGVS